MIDLQLPDEATLVSPLLSINKLDTKKQYDRVTVRITARKVKDVVTVKNKQKQEVIVGDDSGTTIFILWENNIGTNHIISTGVLISRTEPDSRKTPPLDHSS